MRSARVRIEVRASRTSSPRMRRSASSSGRAERPARPPAALVSLDVWSGMPAPRWPFVSALPQPLCRMTGSATIWGHTPRRSTASMTTHTSEPRHHRAPATDHDGRAVLARAAPGAAAGPVPRRRRRARADDRRRLRRAAAEQLRRGLPPDGHRPPVRRPGHRADQAGPARRLPVLARPGGLPGRAPRWRCADGDWLFPTYRDSVAAGRPRRRPGRGADPAARRLALRLRPARAPGRAAVHAAGHPAAARRRASRTRPSCARARTPSRWPCRRRRHQRGRLPRGAELRRRLQGAGRLLRAEQRVRDLACRSRSRPRRRRWPTRASATACPASRSTATTRPPCSRCSARPSSTPARAAARRWSRRTPTACEAHTNADDATRYRDDAEVDGLAAPRDPIARLETLPARARACSTTTAVAAVARGGRGARRATLRDAHERRRPVLDPLDLFAHVYAEPTPQLREQARPVARRAGRRRPTPTTTRDARRSR